MSEQGNPIISLSNVTFSYGKETILKGVDLDIEEGSFICLLGSSGCGKSTLLSLLEGLNFPDSGSVKVNDKEITGPSIDRSVVFQDYSLFPWMSTGENVMLALRQAFPKLPEKERKERANKYFKLMGLENVYKKLPGELSGGMRQRAAIARAFSIEAPILLMDEPFGALDAITRSALQDLLLEMWSGNGKKRTVVFVTHDVDEALLLATRIIVLADGVVKEDLSVDYEGTRFRDYYFLEERTIALRQKILSFLETKEEEKTWTYSI